MSRGRSALAARLQRTEIAERIGRFSSSEESRRTLWRTDVQPLARFEACTEFAV